MTTVVVLPPIGFVAAELAGDQRHLAEGAVEQLLARVGAVLEHDVEHRDEGEHQREDAEERPVRHRRGQASAAVLAEALERGHREGDDAVALLERVEVAEQLLHPTSTRLVTPVTSPGARDARVVDLVDRLPDLSSQLRRQRRRWRRRSPRDHRPPRPPRRPRRRRRLAVADLSVAARRQRLRHQRLPRHRSGLRHARAVRRAVGRGARAGHEAGDGPRGEPHVRRAPVVRRVALERRQPQARLVLVAAGAAGHRGRRAGSRADQLAVVLLRVGVGARPGDGGVLPPPVLPEAARPQLGEPGRSARRSTR